jgi:hypothetical protein
MLERDENADGEQLGAFEWLAGGTFEQSGGLGM